MKRPHSIDSMDLKWTTYCDTLEREKAELEHHAKNLLAVCHRDGGHHTEEVALYQSCMDAETLINELRKENDELEERLRKATALVEIKTAAGKDLFDLLEECEIKLRKAEEALKGLKEEL